MQELDYDHTVHEKRHSMDHKLFVRFFLMVQPDEEKTKTEGRRCFRDCEMIQIMVPGDKRNIVIREARVEDKDRFSDLYAKWSRDRKQDVLDGYPLSEWSQVTPSMSEELRYMGFRTVEHVANANDAACGRMAGLNELKRRAQAWLEMREKQAPLEHAQAELDKRDERIANLEADLRAMREVLTDLRDMQKKAQEQGFRVAA